MRMKNQTELLQMCYEKNIKIAELEQENAELKEKYNKMDIIGYDALKNLTRAKKLLNEFMRLSKASDEDFEHDYSELIGETEQFLNDEKVVPYSYISCRNCDREDCKQKSRIKEIEK